MTVVYAIIGIAAAAIAGRVYAKINSPNNPLCRFRPLAENPILITNPEQASRFIRHLYEAPGCPSCDRALQKALNQPWHFSRRMYEIWVHLTPEQFHRLETSSFRPRTVIEPLTPEEEHLNACKKCRRHFNHRHR